MTDEEFIDKLRKLLEQNRGLVTQIRCHNCGRKLDAHCPDCEHDPHCGVCLSAPTGVKP